MAEVSSSSMEFTPEEERILVKDIALAAEAKSKEGDTFYLITQRFETIFFFFNTIISASSGYSYHHKLDLGREIMHFSLFFFVRKNPEKLFVFAIKEKKKNRRNSLFLLSNFLFKSLLNAFGF